MRGVRTALAEETTCRRFCAIEFCVVVALAVPLLWSSFAVARAADTSSVPLIQNVVRTSMAVNHLKAVIVQVRSTGTDVYTGAFGDSMTGVPATPEMHFRNGALAFTYMATLLLEFVDQKKVTLETKLSNSLSRFSQCRRITLRNLAPDDLGATADYVYQPGNDARRLCSIRSANGAPEELGRKSARNTHGVRAQNSTGATAHELRHSRPKVFAN